MTNIGIALLSLLANAWLQRLASKQEDRLLKTTFDIPEGKQHWIQFKYRSFSYFVSSRGIFGISLN